MKKIPETALFLLLWFIYSDGYNTMLSSGTVAELKRERVYMCVYVRIRVYTCVYVYIRVYTCVYVCSLVCVLEGITPWV